MLVFKLSFIQMFHTNIGTKTVHEAGDHLTAVGHGGPIDDHRPLVQGSGGTDDVPAGVEPHAAQQFLEVYFDGIRSTVNSKRFIISIEYVALYIQRGLLLVFCFLITKYYCCNF